MNILLVTPLYPSFTKENNTTWVCHFFAKEWVNMGHSVRVLHIQAEYPIIIKCILILYRSITGRKGGGGYFYNKRLWKREVFVKDGVTIYHVPVYKILPRFNFLPFSLSHAISAFNEYLKNEKFKPDIVTGHMLPLDIIPQINVNNAKTCFVSHGLQLSDVPKMDVDEEKNRLRFYSCIGYRSKAIKDVYDKLFGIMPNSFICYSGIPKSYLSDIPHSFNKKKSILYVGDLIQRKHPIALLKAFIENSDIFDRLQFIGEGPEEQLMREIISKSDVADRIVISRKIPRDKIIEFYDNNDIMAMVSEGEAFGLVYLEAMARGCITIGSENEGIDGVIVSGQNGYLCPAGDINKLSSILRAIDKLSDSEINAISSKARETAGLYTDENAAKMYIENILSNGTEK